MRILKYLKHFFIAVFLISYAGVLYGVDTPQDQKKPETSNQSTSDFWSLVKSDVKFKKISVGDVDEVWAVGEDDYVYQLTSDGWEKRIEGIDVGVAEDDTVIVVKKNNEVVSRDEEEDFEPIKDIKLTSVAVGSNDAIWGIYKEGDKTTLYHFDDGKWEKVKNGFDKEVTNLNSFAVNADEVVYTVDDKGNVYRRDLDRLELLKKMDIVKGKMIREKARGKRHKLVKSVPVVSTTTESKKAEPKTIKTDIEQQESKKVTDSNTKTITPKSGSATSQPEATDSNLQKSKKSVGGLKRSVKKSKSVGMGKIVRKEVKKHNLAKEKTDVVKGGLERKSVSN